MSVRFRKSIKLGKGLRVNFSKSGASFTSGIPGFSFTAGKKGLYMNTGIPGTGFSTRNKIIGNSKSSSNRNKHYKTVSQSINLKMDDYGNIRFFYPNGQEITNDSMIRKIKNTPQFRLEKDRMLNEHKKEIAQIVEETNEANKEFIEIYKLAPIVDKLEDYEIKLVNLTCKTYKRQIFPYCQPTKDDAYKILNREAEENIKSIAVWTLKNKRQDYVNANFNERYNILLTKWGQNKNSFDEEQNKIEIEQNEIFKEEYKQDKEALEAAIQGDACYIELAINNWFEECSLPVNISIQYDYLNDEGKLLIDLDLPEIEDMPNEKAEQLVSGNLKLKKKSQKELKEEYAKCVFGIAIFMACNMFNISPQIKTVIISAYTQRRNPTTGDIQDDYIYSIKYVRDKLEKQNLFDIEPISYCMGFENRCNLSSTMIFKIIKPYEN